MKPIPTSVLLIEDEPMFVSLTGEMLKRASMRAYTLVHRSSLKDGLETLRAGDIDVVLLDLNLPDSGAMETLKAVLAESNDTPIIVLTATTDIESGSQAINLGAQDFLVKGNFNHSMLDRAIAYGIERQRLQRTIRKLAVLDELTGLYNRRGFHALHSDILLRAQRPGVRGYLCYFDLDQLKQINDDLGHPKGDEALVEFSSALRGTFAEDALLARLGGDEFAAMGIERVPNAANDALAALDLLLAKRNSEGPKLKLKASSGLALFDVNGPKSLEELTAAADAALYHNKESRRARSKAGL